MTHENVIVKTNLICLSKIIIILMWLYPFLPIIILYIFSGLLPSQLVIHYHDGKPNLFNDINYYKYIVLSFSILALLIQLFVKFYFKNKITSKYLNIYSILCSSLFVLPISADIIVQALKLKDSIVDLIIVSIILIHVYVLINQKKYTNAEPNSESI